jgi:hypothetical protein
MRWCCHDCTSDPPLMQASNTGTPGGRGDVWLSSAFDQVDRPIQACFYDLHISYPILVFRQFLQGEEAFASTHFRERLRQN